MTEARVTLTNEAGLHSRPADYFVRTARLYTADIMVHSGKQSANAKNIIPVILLNVTRGTEMRITAAGEDEDAAVTDLVRLVSSNFTAVNPRVVITG